MAPFAIRQTDNSLPTIVEASTGQSILAIDIRTVDGVTYQTPVFASPEIAAKVLNLLTGESELSEPSDDPLWQRALRQAMFEDLRVAVVAGSGEYQGELFRAVIEHLPEGAASRIRRSYGDQLIEFPDGGRIIFDVGRSGLRGHSIDKLYISRSIVGDRRMNLIPCVQSSPVGEISYF
ncbi:hypothetical protein ACSYDW_01290 [Paeniglutamicibacter sp. R2-26]|uniref:hypothetical protein n=1 Tax=Paeniglutamicibacter sp. R2-26 TaxID=3144417 RepID=UPI003EE6C83F